MRYHLGDLRLIQLCKYFRIRPRNPTRNPSSLGSGMYYKHDIQHLHSSVLLMDC
jgi:hypothetical protein